MKIIKKPLNLEFIRKWIDAGINPIILSILDRRNITSDSDLFNFFSPVIENFYSPFLFTDIIHAYNRIEKAVENNEKIIIFGDIDVDGTTSTVLLYNFLKNFHSNVQWEIPTGSDPYGLDSENIKKWVKEDYKLCITVDCGITNDNEIKFLKENNIDTIIIDHHSAPVNLPDAYAIINPKIEEQILFDDIAACGVTFLFIFGYLFFKSEYYNKKIGLIFKINNKYILNIYKNLIKINQMNIENFNGLLDHYFYYPDENNVFDTVNTNIDNTKIRKLDLIENIYDNSFLKIYKNNEMKSQISLFNKLFLTIPNFDKFIQTNLPYVMLGTLADIMPIRNINRIFTHQGYTNLKNSISNNFELLFTRLGINHKEISSKDISWYICPLLNAPGRMGDATLTVDFLLKDYNDENTIKKLIDVNEKRKKNGLMAYNLFLNKIDTNKKYYNDTIAFFYSSEIDKGVTGITATKLCKVTNCPTIVAAKDGDFYSGSIRGKTDFHFVDFLEKSSDILNQFGGHKNAAGFRLHEEKLEYFKTFLKENCSLFYNIENENEIEIDAEIPLEYLNFELYKILQCFEPFGEINRNPILYTKSLEVIKFFKMGKNKEHLKLFFKTNTNHIIGIFWEKSEWFEKNHIHGSKYNAAYQLELNKYNNQINLQMNIIDMEKVEN